MNSFIVGTFNAPNLLPPSSGPKRYNQLDTKSADYGNLNFSMNMKTAPPAYKRSNSVDEGDKMLSNRPIMNHRQAYSETVSNPQIHSHNTAFEVKNTSYNENSYSNISSFPNEENRFKRILSNENIDLDDFPVPPIPKEFRSSTQLFVPDKMENMIKSLTLEADDLVCKNDYENAKRLYLKVASMDPYDGMIWKSLGHIYLLQGKLMESFNCFQGCLFHCENSLDPNLWFVISEVYNRLELYEYAVSALNSIIEMEPNDLLKFKTHCRLGMILSKTYDLQKASDNFQKALLYSTTPQKNVDIYIKLGLLEEEKGDLAKATLKYESALKLDCEQRKVHTHLAW